MVSDNFACTIQALYRREESLELVRSILTRYIGHLIADLLVNLGERRTAQAAAARAQVDQNKFSLAAIRPQLGCKGLTRIRHSGKCGDDERQRRNHFFSGGTALEALGFPNG